MAADAVSDIFNVREAGAGLLTAGQPTEAQLESVARAGVKVVINLAPHDGPRALADEADSVAALGMELRAHPRPVFGARRRASRGVFRSDGCQPDAARTLVHCAANKRVTAFLGLYRVIRLGWTPDEAFALMRTVWEPDAVWSRFIAAALEAESQRGS